MKNGRPKRRGRPPKGSDKAKAESLEVRVSLPEKESFKEAAELSGLDLSAWVRERLRQSARKELESYGKTALFLK